ncbi:FAD-binding protein [Glycomyces sp. A-F 0318]|uniref:FAD-binding protein n=1 Tax=Glycomyces amatae TaxID=2881355 RepID=UPI001E3F642B|nr:FAD-binding protein [Glycomyces amatae]MCD0445415.1 FAD-binding protein [Glycomyces amatae]
MPTNWAGNVVFAADRIARPATVAELQETVAAADRVRAFGTGHSFNDIADTTGTMVSVAGLPGDVRVAPDRRTASVPAGVPFARVARALHAEGLALSNLGSLPHISVAGAVATGTHGSGDRNRVLSAQVSAIEYVRADGALATVGRGDDAFGGSVVALGALGVATRLELDVRDAFDMRQDLFLDAAWDPVLDAFDAVTSGAYSASLFIQDWASSAIDQILWKSVVEDPDAVPALPPGVDAGRSLARAVSPVAGASDDTVTTQGGSIGPWLERLPHFRHDAEPSNAGDELQSEYFIDRALAPRVLESLRREAAAVNPALLVSEIRTMAADDLWLSGAYRRDTVGVHFTWKPDPAAVAPALAAVERVLADADARPHWGKLVGPAFTDRLPRFPRGRAFRELAEYADPGGKFRNAFLDRVLGA